MQIGPARLAPVTELTGLAIEVGKFLDGWDEARFDRHAAALGPQFVEPATRQVQIAQHAWLLDTGREKILIDPCVGNHKRRQVFQMYDGLDLPWLDRLAAAGVLPGEIDIVFCTHLHVDHCGWNTRLENGRWVPTFPNARYCFSRAERDYWRRELDGVPLREEDRYNIGVFADSVQPVIEAGLAECFEDAAELAPGFSVWLTPGHTAGHCAARFEGAGDGLLFSGDVIHTPVQILEPGWNVLGSFDPAAAIESRRQLLALAADQDLILAPAHFPGDRVCRVRRQAGGFVPVPV